MCLRRYPGKGLAGAQDDTGPEPGAARGGWGELQLSPQSAPFSGGATVNQRPPHIAPSLKLIAIVNPGDPTDANASASALFSIGRIVPLNMR